MNLSGIMEKYLVSYEIPSLRASLTQFSLLTKSILLADQSFHIDLRDNL